MEPIDAVISWVDGYDPHFQARLNAFCISQGLSPRQAIEPTRYQQCNEIYYCLHGLANFAPWIRTIYILTNDQTPQAISEFQGTPMGDKIKVIYQSSLLQQFSVTTPVFNSLGAEWLMWHIEGLSNHFLYLNDDFFIIRPLSIEDFFRQGRLVLRGEWKTQTAVKIQYRLKKCLHLPARIDPHRAWQEESARVAGFHRKFYLLPHAPFALNKATAMMYMRQHAWESNLQYPFRDPNHLSSIPLMMHLDIQAGRTVEDRGLKTVMVNPAHHAVDKIKKRLDFAAKNAKVAFVCMQSLDQASDEMRAYLLNWLAVHVMQKGSV